MDFQAFKKKFEKTQVKEVPNNATQNPKVSVVVQVYQQVNFIRDCLDGILQQKTDFPMEILLGDDESTDGTREVCLDYAQKHSDKIRLFLHHRENNIPIFDRPSPNFNFVYNLYNAKGKYVAICDGDDYWTDPYKLQKQVNFMENNPDYVLTAHKVGIINLMKNREIWHYYNIDNNHFDFNDVLAKHFIPTPSLVFLNLIINYPEWLLKVQCADMAIELMILSKGKGHLFDEKMGKRRHHEAGVSKGNIPNRFVLKNREMMYHGINSFTENANSKVILRRIGELYFTYGRINIRERRFLIALICFIESILKGPGFYRELKYVKGLVKDILHCVAGIILSPFGLYEGALKLYSKKKN